MFLIRRVCLRDRRVLLTPATSLVLTGSIIKLRRMNPLVEAISTVCNRYQDDVQQILMSTQAARRGNAPGYACWLFTRFISSSAPMRH